MVDRASVEQRLARIDQELDVLPRARGAGRERYLLDRSLQREVERALQVSIQACIDVGAHIVAAGGLGAPSDYAGVFQLLARGAGLDRDLADHLKRAARLRNLLVHAYLEIDQDLIWESLDDAEHLRAFAAWALALARGSTS